MKRAAGSLLLALAAPAWALDYASSLRPAILYDAPSAAANKVAVTSAGYPLEKLVSVSGWAKVRDETGRLAWIEESALSSRRTLLVSVALASVMEKPAENSPVRFRATRGVVLDMLPAAVGGWVQVRHANGLEGYVRIGEVWGL
jgi:SH3-like domain-containing protein